MDLCATRLFEVGHTLEQQDTHGGNASLIAVLLILQGNLDPDWMKKLRSTPRDF